jgi:ABC-2 type transport system permease protein
MLRSGLAVFFLAVLIFVGFIALGFIFSRFSSLLFTSQLNWYTLWIAESVNVSKLFRQTLLLTGCGIMLFTAGYYLFDRKDL